MQLINVHLLEKMDTGEADSDENQIYVFAQFFKPGRQTYMTCMVDE